VFSLFSIDLDERIVVAFPERYTFLEKPHLYFSRTNSLISERNSWNIFEKGLANGASLC